MIKQKIFNFLNSILYSSFFLWVLLIFLKKFNLKPEIDINLFFFLSLLLFLILFFKQILIFIRQFLKFLKGFPLFLKFILPNYFFWLILGILGILLDIFVLKFTSDLLILFLTGLWILSVCHFKFKGEASIGLALGFLILCPFLLIFKKDPIAEKSAIWAYMFLLIGVIQMIIEYAREKRY